jgi:hypothetical protein
MNDEPRPPESAAGLNPSSSEAKAEGDSTGARASASPAASPAAVPSKPLTAEEQMALYEDDLKENDWGHQPC